MDHGGRKERRLKHEPAKTRKYNGLFVRFRPVSGSYSNKLRVVNHPIKRGLASAATQAKPDTTRNNYKARAAKIIPPPATKNKGDNKMTKQELTFEAMNGAYLMSNNKINEGYLNDTLQIYIMNEYPIYQMLNSKRTKAHSVVWAALMYDANTRLKWNCYSTTCTSDQLKKWLNTYGRGYETVAATVDFVAEERKTMMEGK